MKQVSERKNTGQNVKCETVGDRAESQTKAQLPSETERGTTERERAGKEEDSGSRESGRAASKEGSPGTESGLGEMEHKGEAARGSWVPSSSAHF